MSDGYTTPDALGYQLGEVACATLFFWDWCLTFSDEVILIWFRPWKASTYLFLSLRYITFALITFNTYAMSETLPKEWYVKPRRSFMIAIIAIVEIILQLRVYVMYMRSKKILISNAILFVSVLATGGGLFVKFGGHIKYLPYSPECGVNCAVYPRGIGYCFIPPLLFEAYLAFLMIRKSWQERRLLPHQNGSDIFHILIRDSLVYFIMVSIAMATAILLFLLAPESALWVDTFLDASGAVGGTRLILSMLGSVHSPTSIEEEFGSIALTRAFPTQRPTSFKLRYHFDDTADYGRFRNDNRATLCGTPRYRLTRSLPLAQGAVSVIVDAAPVARWPSRALGEVVGAQAVANAVNGGLSFVWRCSHLRSASCVVERTARSSLVDTVLACSTSLVVAVRGLDLFDHWADG
ncbi:hypothetical protein EXIGLDRAFT_777180 [Exidia glandulosa HHB12029]|uniref:DUF6533 domain-containing protein n=1 Tax=Exidia glandulosa HHB12029 TaxID=1314781 RepID=A0A165D5R5_EXIGL|nr:hypothetical protein EXIGLDRAFT_777180 [Exidia glandulosa HHB12029]